MAGPITASQLEDLIADDETPNEVLAQYLKAVPSPDRPLVPQFQADTTRVAGAVTRGMLGIDFLPFLNARENRKRNRNFEEKISSGWSGPRLLAEGDSWFLYPIILRDVIDHLDTEHAIFSMAAAGDTLDNMLSGSGEMAQNIRKYDIDAVLVSGGGNDIAGANLINFLAAQTSPRGSIESYICPEYGQFLETTKGRLGDIFASFFSDFPHLQVFLHGYDWPHPQRGGPWLMPAMRSRAVPQDLGASVLRVMIDRYYSALFDVAVKFEGQVTIVDCRGCVGQPQDWYDELHPRDPGYARAADRFRAAIAERFASRTRGDAPADADYEITWIPPDRGGMGPVTRQVRASTALRIGRAAGSDIVLDDPSVSRDHARIEFLEETVRVSDLGSTNGTHVAGQRIGRSEWKPGQLLEVGSVRFELSCRKTAAEAALKDEGPLRGASADKATVEVELCLGNIVDADCDVYVVALFDNVSPISSNGAPLAIDKAVNGRVSALAQGGRFVAELGNVTLTPIPAGSGLTGEIALAGLGTAASFGPHVIEQVGSAIGEAVAKSGLKRVAAVPIGANIGLDVSLIAKRFVTGFVKGFGSVDHVGQAVCLLRLCELGSELLGPLKSGLDAVPGSVGAARTVVQLERLPNRVLAPVVPHAATRARVTPLYIFVDATSENYSYTVLAPEPGASIPRYDKAISAPAFDELEAALSGENTITVQQGEQVAKNFLPDTLAGIIQAAAEQAEPIVFVLDQDSSKVPWEAMHIGGKSPILAGGVSRLHKSNPKRNVCTLRREAGEVLRLLVIEDPANNLPGAKLEGRQLAELFAGRLGAVTVLAGENATKANVRDAMFGNEFDIVHYAGHADFDEDNPSESGLILNDGRLHAVDLEDLNGFPQLVFLNACESGRIRGEGSCDAIEAQRSALVSLSLAEGFLAMGAANFVGTYWPVNDIAASEFAMAFYSGILDGEPIGIAMRDARRKIHEISPSDWMNYMHFGEPSYVMRRSRDDL